MYWTIPETCMAVVCACLPSLRPLFHGWSPESLVGSVRSAFSLHSLGQQRSQTSSENRSRHGFKNMQLTEGTRNVSHEDVEMPSSAGNHTNDKDAIKTDVTDSNGGYHLRDEP